MSRKQNSLMKFSRTERLAQLSEQEIVIEKKKKEILAKLEAQKKKVSEEAFRKSEPAEEINSDNSKFSKNLSQNRDDYQKEQNKEKLGDNTKSERLTNAFSNDGTFLDQFKKLTKNNLSQTTPKVQSPKSKEENSRSRKNTEAAEDAYKSLRVNSQFPFLKKPLNTNIQMALSPAGVQLMSTNQASGMSHSEDAANPVKFSSSSKQASSDQVSETGLGLEAKNSGGASTFSNSSSAFPNSSKSLQNIPFKSKKCELPKVRSESISMTLKSNSVKRLEAIPNPLGIEDEAVSPPAKKSNFVFSKKKETCKEGGGNFLKNVNSGLPVGCTLTHEDFSNVSSALTKGEGNDKEGGDSPEMLHKWAVLVAQYGDDFEDILQQRSDPDLRFLKEKESKLYITYRKLVLNYRSNFRPPSSETSEKQALKSLMTDSPQAVEEIRDEKIKFSEQGPSNLGDVNKSLTCKSEVEADSVIKDTSGSLTDNEVLPYYKMPELELEKDCFASYQKQIPQEETQNENSTQSTSEISNGAKTEERRKRKRKSRWGDVVASPSTSTAETNPILQPTGKLPKSTLLSQLTRSDPGLIQYARQTFGSTNLSEEDWKKAEDHYKINLLYQDMVKKRAEVEKLEKQGKFKYEYDSDEDTEGGTWEHKLRQQEMQATQLWAEELTRQAAGKHHIGDFLPPEELERFMEKYNAVKQGREPDLSDYKEFKLKEDNVGYRLLQKMGWNEGQGLGQDGSGITNPVNKAIIRHENQGLGVERPDGLEPGDDEYDAYRKRMMLAYRFRPNPLNNPRRPYY